MDAMGMQRKSLRGVIFSFLCGVAAMTWIAIVLLWTNAVWPYQWHLPAGMSLVLEFSTDMGVEDTINVLRTRYFVDDKDITVKVIKEAQVFFKKVPVRHSVVIENFSAPGLSKRRMECRFLQNRLMTILFQPALTDEECKTLLGVDYHKYLATQLWYFGEDSEGSDSTKVSDELLFIDWVWGSGIHSKLLWRAYADWSRDKGK